MGVTLHSPLTAISTVLHRCLAQGLPVAFNPPRSTEGLVWAQERNGQGIQDAVGHSWSQEA